MNINLKNENNPLVSVIIPVYKVEQYLDRCVQSVLNQTYRDIEIILVDDGTPDRCGALCDNYELNDARVVVLHKENGGLSSARNAGIEVAKGEYLSFVDSDDWISLDMIEYMVSQVKKNDADIVSVAYVLTNDEKQTVSEKDKIRIFNREQALEYFLDIGMKSRVSDYPVCIKLIKRELFDDVQFPIGTLYEDYTTNIQLIKKCKIYVKSTKICYFYFQGGQSIVRSCYKRQDEQLIRQCQKVCDYLLHESVNVKRFAAEKLSRSYLSLLTKIAVYGFANDISSEDRKIISKNLTKQLRNNFFILLKSSMPISRKILLILLCIDYRLLTFIKGRGK